MEFHGYTSSLDYGRSESHTGTWSRWILRTQYRGFDPREAWCQQYIRKYSGVMCRETWDQLPVRRMWLCLGMIDMYLNIWGQWGREKETEEKLFRKKNNLHISGHDSQTFEESEIWMNMIPPWLWCWCELGVWAPRKGWPAGQQAPHCCESTV